MNARQIEAFRTVMLVGTTSRAAEVMHTSQPAISRLLGQLEASLRLRLFERERSRLRPTPEAKALMVDVERLFAGLDQIKARAHGLRDGQGGLLTVACYPAMGYGLMPDLISQLKRTLPRLTVKLEIFSSSEVRERVISGRCDVGFAADEVDSHGIVAQLAMRKRALLAVPAGHPLCKKKIVPIKDLARYPFIALAETDTTRRTLQALLAKEGASLDVAVETPYSLTVASFVANGVGIGLINPIVLDAFGSDKLRLLPIKEDIWFQAMVIHSASTPLAAPAKALLKILQKTSSIEE